MQNRNSSVLYANKFNEAPDLFSREIFYFLPRKNRYRKSEAPTFLILNNIHPNIGHIETKSEHSRRNLACYLFNIF